MPGPAGLRRQYNIPVHQDGVMYDPRIEQLATVLVEYSIGVQPGELVVIQGHSISLPALEATYRRVVQAGGHPHLQVKLDSCEEYLLAHGSEKQLGFQDPLAQQAVETMDAYIGFWGEENTKVFSQVDPQRQQQRSLARKAYLERFLDRAAKGTLRWVGSQFPCHASAQDAEMSLRGYEDFVFSAGKLDHHDPIAAWRAVSERQQRVADYLNCVQQVRFVTPQGTDLTVRVAGRKWINCDGHENFPDGEVFTGPLEDATQGVVCYSFPAVYGGREVDGIRLEFRDGRVVDASASKGQDFLIAMLDQDPGGRVLGEVALGTNYSITRYTKNTLFDEKIGGTFHAALGSSYPETGGRNQSALHWDMVCDLRQGGTVYADGKVISENGRFVDPQWPAPETT
jgi:aminopeptidase